MKIGDRIRELRIEKGFSQEDLANRTNFSKSYIQKFEESQREIKSSQLAQLAEALNVDISEILNSVEYTSNEFLIKSIEFREANKLEMDIEHFKRKALTILHKKYLAYSKLEKIVGQNLIFQNPLKNFRIISSNEDIEDAAKILRKKWKFENTPIYDLISFLEDLGIKVFEVVEDEDFVGLSCWVKNTPIILINTRNTDVSRRRFTVLHELCHLLLIFKSDERKENIEHFCDQFAGAMLLPEEILKSYVNSNISITLEELKRIKSKYGISILAILVRMVNIKLINWDKYRQWKEMYISWTEKDEENEHSGRENAGRFNYLLAKGLRENLLSKDLACELSGIPISKLSNNSLNKEFKF
jgi:Zn-dependent peptidase ImmA (M78 family)/DNA-binding Xre family transcriptional regulator